jgi:aerobic-type carbon monoxide dehydrogenase small subunit (CoxS/CutS family)
VRWRRTRRSSICCATVSRSAARAKAAAKGCAAAAPCWSTAKRCRAVSTSPCSPTATELVTVEGLADGDTLHPVQEAFIEAGAFQCGFCTPGFVLMTTQLLAAHPDPSEDQIRHYLSGNLCRCGTYPQIVEAVKLAARKLRIG